MGIALISGASSGIGEALAWEFAAGGHDLVLVARSADKLTALGQDIESRHPVNVYTSPADLSKRGAARRLAGDLEDQGLEIDSLVNCAGVLEHGAFNSMPAGTHQRLIDLNIGGLTAMLAQFLPPMTARGAGRIMNVASIAAFQPVPSLTTYAATKAYVLSLSESLSEELKDTGVTVTALCPGVTDTNMFTTAQEKSAGLRLPRFAVGEVGDVARQGYEACMKGEVICVPGALNQAAALTTRALPRWAVRRVFGAFGRSTFD
jgi:short-subunit dehydrogenase